MSHSKRFVVCLFAVIIAAPAWAVVLTPGNFVNINGTTSLARPELAGVVLEDVLRPFAVDLGGGLTFKGTVQDRVVRENVSGTLNFYYQITNDPNSQGFVDFVTRQNYSGYSTDVDFRTDGNGMIGPDQVSRAADGKEVLFDFFASNLLNPGQESYFFFVKTNATVYGPGGTAALAIGAVTGAPGKTISFDTFQPVPEPGTFGMLAVVAVACACRELRRRAI